MNLSSNKTNTAAQKRLRRFMRRKRSCISAVLLLLIAAISLCADLICNNKPLYIRYNGKSYFPVLGRHHPESTFIPNGSATRPDYKVIAGTPSFHHNPTNIMIFAPLPFSPDETVDENSINPDSRVTVTLIPLPRVGSVNIDADFMITRAVGAGAFFGTNDAAVAGLKLTRYRHIHHSLQEPINKRFRNESAPPIERKSQSRISDIPVAILSMSTFRPRMRPPKTVRITLRESQTRQEAIQTISLDDNFMPLSANAPIWRDLNDADKALIRDLAADCRNQRIEPFTISTARSTYRVHLDNSVSWPFPPIKGHWMGLDKSGRDVLALVIYGLRTSLLFGGILTLASIVIGIIVGSVQGYYGGKTDIAGQRFIEIWSAIPFLYVMILLGSIYGAGFTILLVCYGAFNWIRVSYYVRAEFLRLRNMPFVDSAKVAGIPTPRIIFRHILPNAITPVVTFLPFSLVGAIGSLAALDYLGFGLPPLTPSLGQLLQQAQNDPSAWWLILYPSLTLFIVMLLGVFVGEGVREAYDPRPRTRME